MPYILARFSVISGSFGLAMCILARVRLIRIMARPNSPDITQLVGGKCDVSFMERPETTGDSIKLLKVSTNWKLY